MLSVSRCDDGVLRSLRDQDGDLESFHDSIAVDGAGEHPETCGWRHDHTAGDEDFKIFRRGLFLKKDS